MTHRGCGCCGGCPQETDNFNVAGWEGRWNKGVGEEYTRKNPFPVANYDFSVEFGEFFGYSGQTFTITLDNGGSPLFSRTFSVYIDPTPINIGGTNYYDWYLRSTGTGGTWYHSETRLTQNALSSVEKRGVYGTYTVLVRVRDDVIEFKVMGGGTSESHNKSSPDIYYVNVPTFMTTQAGISLTGKFSLELGSQPKPATILSHYHGISHEADNLNMDCPPGICTLIDPYTHIPWRISNVNIGGETIAPVKEIHHYDCCVTFDSDPLTVLTTDAETAFGTASVTAVFKHPLYATVYRPSGVGMFLDGGSPYLGVKNRSTPQGGVCAAAEYIGPAPPGWVLSSDPAQPFTAAEVMNAQGLDLNKDPFTCFQPFPDAIFYYAHQAGSSTSSNTSTVNSSKSWSYTTSDLMRFGIATNLYPIEEPVAVDWEVCTLDRLDDRTTSVDIQEILDDTLDVLEKNHYYLVTSAKGYGLLFTHEVGGVYVPVDQVYAPVAFLNVLDVADQQDIQGLLAGSTVTWWYEVAGDFYSIDSTGHHDPLVNGWVEPPRELIVRIEAVINYHTYLGSNSDPYTEIYTYYGHPGWASVTTTNYPNTLPPPLTRPYNDFGLTRPDPIAANPINVSTVNLSDYVLNPSILCNSAPVDAYPVEAIRSVDYGWRVSTNVENGTAFQTNTGAGCTLVTVTPSIRRFGARYDGVLTIFSETWIESGYAEEGQMVTLDSVVFTPVVIWERVFLHPGHVLSLPTFAINVDDMISDNINLKILKSIIFDWGNWVAESPTNLVETFKIVYEHEIVPTESITFNIGL